MYFYPSIESRLLLLLLLDVHAMVQREGTGLMEPPLGVCFVAIFRNDFAFSEKPLIFSTT